MKKEHITTPANMVLTVQTISKHTIKPSSPTPPHLRSLQLSSRDQTAPQIFTHLLLFYTTAAASPTDLKTSLSQTLAHFYPLAGRIRLSESTETLCVDCDDQGVEFVESSTEADLALFLVDPPIDRFNELLPIKVTEFRWVEDPLLAVQLTRFLPDEGLALGVSVSHLIADGASVSSFLNCWSGIARGTDPAPCRFDSASAFPPRASLSNRALPDRKHEDEGNNIRIRRFSIGKMSMERLRRGGGATRVETVSALVWRCLERARGKAGALSHEVDVRRRMWPPLRGETVGNLNVSVVAASGGAWRTQEEAEGEIRRAVRKVDGGYVRGREAGGWVGEGEVSWIFSSWCRMGWYANDFGWGEPVWFGCGIRDMKDVCILIDAQDGDGMEVWLWLEREEMERVGRDREFLDFAVG